MKTSESFSTDTPQAKGAAINRIRDLAPGFEIVIREITSHKSQKQLDGIFGCWVQTIVDLGHSQSAVHARWKREFLEGIYIADPVNDEQEMWVYLHYQFQLDQDFERLEINRSRISLKWANLSQTKEYMNLIESHYQNTDYPLPPLDPKYKTKAK
jgi:hypothetical protein